MKNNLESPHSNKDFQELIFSRTQEIQQQAGESSKQLHERLRDFAINSFNCITSPTKIKTPSWYTFDLSKIGIEGGG